MQSVSIIVPTLNEVENIGELFSRISQCGLPQTVALELIIVDDASADGTGELVEKTTAGFPVKLLRREGKLGLASAIMDGVRIATGEIVLVMDADLSHPPEAIPQLLAPLLSGACDMSIGSRYIPGGRTPGWSLRRRITSRLATFFAWPFVDVKDPMSGFFAVFRERLLQLQTGVSGFKIALAILVAGGDTLRVQEIPIEFQDRYRGTSKLGAKVILQYLEQLLLFAGGDVRESRFIIAAVLGLVTDLTLFGLFFAKGIPAVSAQVWSFIGAGCISGWLYFSKRCYQKESLRAPVILSSYLLFAMMVLLTLFLRGGILSFLNGFVGWTLPMAISAATVVAAGVQYLSFIVFVSPIDTSNNGASVRWRVLSVCVIGYSLLLRLVYIGSPELLHEEAYYWNYAQHLDVGYLDHPPAIAWIIHVFTSLFGDTEFGVRFGALVCWCVTAFFSYQLTKRIYNKSSAIRALLLIAVLPIFFGAGFLMTPDAPLIACWSGAIYFAYQALLNGKPRAWHFLGICIGLGMLSKYTIALLGLALLLFLMVDRSSRHWFTKPAPYWGALWVLVLFSPVVIWNFQHGWASFLFQGPQRVMGRWVFSVHELFGGILLLITPTGVAAALSILLPQRPYRREFLSSADNHSDRKYLFTLVFLLVPLSVFFAFSCYKSVKLNWTGPAWLVILPFIAHLMVPISKDLPRRLFGWVSGAWPVTIAVSLFVFGAWLHYWSLGFPGLSYPQNFPLVGARDLGQKIEQIENEVESLTGADPLVVGMDKYRMASLLAFYRPENEENRGDPKVRESVSDTSGCHLFGGDSLMYRFWYPEETGKDRVMILVSPKKNLLNSIQVSTRVREHGEVKELSVQKNGITVGLYYYMIVKGYMDQKEPAHERGPSQDRST